MNDPRIDFMLKTGFVDRAAMDSYELFEGRYLEDIFGEEIKPGDTYFIDNHGQLIHSKSLVEYVTKDLDFVKYER